MKQHLYLTFLFLILSCNNERNIEGTWYYNYLSETSSSNEVPERITFRNDSVIFNYPYFDFLENHSVKIENSHLYFKNFEVPFKVSGDTLIINEKQKFTKTPSEPFAKDYIENKSDIKIDLPQLNQYKFQLDKYNNDNIFLKFYGVHPKTNRQYLLINDVYINEFSVYLSTYGGHGPSPVDLLFVDKNALMFDLEKVFLAAKFMNQLKVIFVNDI